MIMGIGVSEGTSSGAWQRAARGRGWWRPGGSSQRVTHRARQQLAPDLAEISQGEHGMRPGQVLDQAPVPHFDEAPQMLDHAERMLAAGAGPRAGAVDLLPARGKLGPGVGAPISIPRAARSCCSELPSVVTAICERF